MKPFVHVNIGLLAANVGITAANTLDGSHGKHDLLLSINVGVQHTQNVLKIFVRHQRLLTSQYQMTKQRHGLDQHN